MKDNYLFFADGDGVDATGDAGMYAASKFLGASAANATTTDLFFEGATGVGDGAEKVTLTHADGTTTTGHKVKDLGKALAALLTAHPHSTGKIINVVDLTNSVTAAGFEGVTGVAITIDS
tara:strand:+ start:768 stop:1127 length:360 start_codon:yes stop_codon:yes gene_type:complete